MFTIEKLKNLSLFNNSHIITDEKCESFEKVLLVNFRLNSSPFYMVKTYHDNGKIDYSTVFENIEEAIEEFNSI